MLGLDNFRQLHVKSVLDGLLVDSCKQVTEILELYVGEYLLAQLAADVGHALLVVAYFLLVFLHTVFLAHFYHGSAHILQSLVCLLLGGDEAVGVVDAVAEHLAERVDVVAHAAYLTLQF